MTVLDTSGVIDLLLGGQAAKQVEGLLDREGSVAAPELLVFEVLAVLRRDALRHAMTEERAAAAIDDLGDVSIELFPSLPLRSCAWGLRHNLTAADALFVALAERLEEPLATKDRGLAAAARSHAAVEVIHLEAAD
ncbi:MAG: type II toxin-antitoxin system VapC family toxin [Actinomycetota bacterium]|nr:type II toxin-antitoxin system VapC family toxin [Actinomycetota bacterium]